MLYAMKNQVILEPMFAPEKTSGGIWIPDQAVSRVNQGMVKYIGPDVKSVKIGDHVIFSGYAGTLMKLEGEGLVLIMPETYIHAIIEEEPYEVQGLFFRDSQYSYFPATYEQIMFLVAKAASESNSFRNRSFKEHPKTTAEEYATEDTEHE